jgi:hypothetical protein
MPYYWIAVIMLLFSAIVVFVYFYAKRAKVRTDSSTDPTATSTPTERPE